MREIGMKCGKFAIVDDSDYEAVAALRWGFTDGYAVHYVKKNGKVRPMLMHRFLLNPPAGMQVDHINGNRLDNRRENLRLATTKQNCMNKAKRSDSRNRYRGCVYHPTYKSRPWQAKMRIEGKSTSLGYYATEEEAALAFNNAAKKHHGEFAKLNEICL